MTILDFFKLGFVRWMRLIGLGKGLWILNYHDDASIKKERYQSRGLLCQIPSQKRFQFPPIISVSIIALKQLVTAHAMTWFT